MQGSGVDCFMGGAALAARVCAALNCNSVLRQLGAAKLRPVCEKQPTIQSSRASENVDPCITPVLFRRGLWHRRIGGWLEEKTRVSTNSK
jgi:hypothetical protein